MSFRAARYFASASKVPVGARAVSSTTFRAQNINAEATSQPEVESQIPPTDVPTNEEVVHEPSVKKATRLDSSKIAPLEPPSPVKSGWPTPWINKNDFEKYLGPLYHRGWGVRYLSPRQKGDRTSAELFANYKFATFTAATNFVQAVGQIAASEKHHPRLLAASYKKTPEVALYTLTHSARPRGPASRPPTGDVPGITARDVRLAILADALYTKEYAEKVHGPRILAPLTRKPYWFDFIKNLNSKRRAIMSVDLPLPPPLARRRQSAPSHASEVQEQPGGST